MTSTRGGFRVSVEESDGGWRVAVLDPAGEVASERACRDEAEARTFASTVGQHIHWLSEEKFREYYRLREAGEGGD
ncbi:MAG: hypothetical protein ACT4PO_08665 [Actinomycetota bacterium]